MLFSSGSSCSHGRTKCRRIVATSLAERAVNAADAPQVVLDVTGLTPCQALVKLKEALPHDKVERTQWCNDARVSAVLGSCPDSRSSFKSGIRNYNKFCHELYGSSDAGYPPTVDGIVLWSLTFQCVGTFANYLGFLRGACIALVLEVPQVDHPAVKRAKVGIIKRMLFSPKPRMFLQRTLVRNLVLRTNHAHIDWKFAMLWCVAYWFLLRVPSEALPMTRGVDKSSCPNAQSVIFLEADGTLCLRLKKRKNKLSGSLLKRSCSCRACKHTCPVHVVWDLFFKLLEVGCQPWATVSAGEANKQLRLDLQTMAVHISCSVGCASHNFSMQVPDHSCYGSHDFRRGHAKVVLYF